MGLETSSGFGRLIIPSEDGSLILSQFAPEDAPEIFALIARNRDFLSQHGEATGLKYATVDSVIESIVSPENPARMRFCIREGVSQVYAGSINLTPTRRSRRMAEIGYYLGEEFTGRGVATLAVTTLTMYAFNRMEYVDLYGIVAATNIASRRVLEKAGYRTIRSFSEFDRDYSELHRFKGSS